MANGLIPKPLAAINMNLILKTAVLIICFITFSNTINSQSISDSVSIETLNETYVISEKIHFQVKNYHNSSIFFNKCDQFPIMIPNKLKKFNGLNWVDEELYVVCTTMGIMGYWSEIKSLETAIDSSFSINESGIYRVCYDYTLHACSKPDSSDHYETWSNEFSVVLPVTLERTKQTWVNIFPNPVQRGNAVDLVLGDYNRDIQIYLISCIGQEIKHISNELANNNLVLDTSELQTGIYFLVFVQRKDVTYQKLIVY